MTAADVGNNFGDEEGIEARRTLACNETGRLLKKGVNSPNAGTPNDANAVLGRFGFCNSLILNGFIGRNET